MLRLTAVEARVLGALVEKERTTPDSYPLTTNALVAACNQKTSRAPVMSLEPAEVDAAMLELRKRGMARTVRGTGERTFKHLHTADDAFGVDAEGLACLAVLVLRGPQTPGELRTRTERYVEFADIGAVEATLRRLAERDEPLAANTGRGPGQSQDRWVELVSESGSPGDVPPHHSDVPAGQIELGARLGSEVGISHREARPQASATTPDPGAGGAVAVEVERLRAEVQVLRGLVEEIRTELGMDPGPAFERPEET